MRLNLALNGILVASASLDPARCQDKFYMKAMRRLLCLQNQDVLERIPGKPVYYIEVPAGAATQLFADRHLKVPSEVCTERLQEGELANLTTCANLGSNALFSAN